MNATLTDELTVVPAPPRRSPPALVPEGTRPPRMGRGWAFLLAAGWPAVLLVMMAIEPAPAANPPAVAAFVGTVVFLALSLAIGGTMARAIRRDPSAAAWSAFAGLMAVVATVSCPVSGHHQSIGAWWFVQMGISVGMLALSRAAAQSAQSATSSS